MTREENKTLRELLEKKMEEYRTAIEIIEERCGADECPEEAEEETRGLRNALRHARNFAYQLREADDNYTELTLEHIRADREMVAEEPTLSNGMTIAEAIKHIHEASEWMDSDELQNRRWRLAEMAGREISKEAYEDILMATAEL